MKVNFAFHLEIKVWRKSGETQNPSCLKSSVKFPKSVMIWGVVTSVGPLCFIKSKVNAAVYQEIQQSRRAEGSIVPQQCHRLIASMPHLTDAGVCAKGAPTNY